MCRRAFAAPGHRQDECLSEAEGPVERLWPGAKEKLTCAFATPHCHAWPSGILKLLSEKSRWDGGSSEVLFALLAAALQFLLPDSVGALLYHSVTSPALCVPGGETASPM